jgi:hypothetical protein
LSELVDSITTEIVSPNCGLLGNICTSKAFAGKLKAMGTAAIMPMNILAGLIIENTENLFSRLIVLGMVFISLINRFLEAVSKRTNLL